MRVRAQLPNWGYTDIVADHHRTVDKGLGRIEPRDCWTVTDATFLDYAHWFLDVAFREDETHIFNLLHRYNRVSA